MDETSLRQTSASEDFKALLEEAHPVQSPRRTMMTASAVLPGAFSELIKKDANVAIKSLRVRAYPSGNRHIMEYSVQWHQSVPDQSLRSIVSKLPKVDRASVSNAAGNLNPSSTNSSPLREFVISAKPAPARNSERGSVSDVLSGSDVALSPLIRDSIPGALQRCDGPCGKQRHVDELQRMGRCDHLICTKCMADAPTAKDCEENCAAKLCVALNLAEMQPNEADRERIYELVLKDGNYDYVIGQTGVVPVRSETQVTSNASTVGEDGPVEMFSVHATIFEKADDVTCRRHLDLEFRSDMPLLPCLQRLLQNTGLKLQHADVYVGVPARSSGTPQRWLKSIDLDKHGGAGLYKFPRSHGILRFVIDFTASVPKHKQEQYDG
ncbi:hypothetical protein AAVH_12372 [Aphelenchoides avenae]|nr:hypothetical protein AAVH_12372 [Aphelenchus avenae]